MTENRYDVIIIGGGLGGLECGYILSKKGLSVCIIEKERQAGGCLQTFKRNGSLFDTGFHYVGGLEKGQVLHRVFDYFNLLDLPWYQMDKTGFEEVIFEEESYLHAAGHDRFVETLAAKFPSQRQNLQEYVGLLKSVSSKSLDVLSVNENHSADFYTSLFSQSAYNYLKNRISDQQLMNVLSGSSAKLFLNPEKLPLYTFAQINGSYIESAWRIQGGGSQITNRLLDQIRTMGGSVFTGREVVALHEQEGKIISATMDNGEVIQGDTFISNIHPSSTLNLVRESKKIRPIYRKRIQTLNNTPGICTVNIKLKKNRLPYLNRNVHIHTGNDPWSYHSYIPGRRGNYIAVSYMVPKEGKYAEGLDILTPMYWEEVSRWEGTDVGRRGEAYREFKEEKAAKCIELASHYITGLKDAVDKVYTSTPLTYTNYTGTEKGSAYGIEKDYNALMYTVIAPKTPVKNLFLTGQNLNVHGILGVSMTAFLTCREIIGSDCLNDFLKH